MQARVSQHPVLRLRHSVGGQLLGLANGVEHIDAVATYGCGFGYWGEMPRPYRYFVAGLWYVGIPIFSRVFGYFPAKAMGLGEDLPAGVVQDWARWGKRKTYFAAEIGDAPGFKLLNAPFRAILASDDNIATGENYRRLYDMFETDIEVEHIDPTDFGCSSLGHVEFFSRRHSAAWRVVPDWFDRQI